MSKPKWSMADDRELIVLSKTKSLEAIADQLGRSPKFILGKAARLGERGAKK
jgi:hypothetical protein